MNVAFGILASIAVVQAGIAPLYPNFIAAVPTNLVRAPQYDSAIVHSDRVGGNFAYSIAQSHAFVPHPVATYNYDPSGYSYNQYNPFTPLVPAHHFYVQHPIYHNVPSFVPASYPVEQPSEFPEEPSEEPIESAEPDEQTENPDSEIVNVDDNEDNSGNIDEITEEYLGGGSNDAIDDSITVDAYRFSSP